MKNTKYNESTVADTEDVIVKPMVGTIRVSVLVDPVANATVSITNAQDPDAAGAKYSTIDWTKVGATPNFAVVDAPLTGVKIEASGATVTYQVTEFGD